MKPIYYGTRGPACYDSEIVQGVPALSFDESASFSAPAAFGTYRVLHQIGSGVLGPVFRTYEPQRDRLVAVKAFKLDIVPEDVARLADSLRKLVAAHLTHPHIVPAIDAGLEGTTAYLAMDYVSGETLDVALRHLAPSTLDRAAPVLSSIAQAIEAGWAAGFGHGALHPRDVFLVAGTDDVMVTGFGVLQSLEAAGVKAPARRPYSAPERTVGEPWDIRADVYSLGAIAHELLTRRRPAGSGEQDGSFATGMTPEQRVWIRKILAAALNERPANRFATPTAFAEAIAAVARGEAPEALPEVVDVPVESDAAPSEIETKDRERPRKKPAPAAPLFETIEPAAAKDETPVVVDEARATDTAPATAVAPDHQLPAPEPELTLPPPAVEATPFVAAPVVETPTPATPTPVVTRSTVSTPSSAAPSVTPPRRPAMIPDPESFRTRLPAAPLLPPSPEKEPYPWLAIAAGVVAGIAIGVVGTYMLVGARTPPPAPVTAQAPTPIVGPGTPSDTDVKVVPPETPSAAKPETPKSAETTPATPDRSGRAAAPVVTSGRVTIRTAPSGASVSIDGQPRVSAPADIKDLPMGAHTAVISRSGYETRTEKFTLTPAAPAKELSVTLVAIAAPASAKASAGQPGSGRASAGEAASGRASAGQAASGKAAGSGRASASQAAPAKSPASQMGTISFDSRPRGATVIVDGKNVGVTPTQAARLPAGSHAVRIELSGYKTLTTSVVVKAGETTPIAVSLEVGRGGGPHTNFREKR